MSDLTPKEARLVFALLKMRASQISAALKQVTPFIEQEPGDKNAALLGAARLGKVAMTEPEVKAIVNDREKFVAFVQETAPTEVEHIPTVRTAYEMKLLEQALRNGAPVDADGQEIPGVEIGYGASPQQRFYADEGADRLLAVVEPKDLPELDGIDLTELLGVRPAIEAGEQS
ncbi:hypothetical protein [Nonomuraea basaltis]|uniref:hypothetical protein n=1 Tax=Nonomuraea basaltis TaxID=2495887 RepID=UPI00110C4BB4|nr:hypothetical protein [Nonomuraea basaltis]TMS00119.1 hypothetical protein EJK15_03345 [Nonomuraea basaltis]